jgi:hypothetical protein
VAFEITTVLAQIDNILANYKSAAVQATCADLSDLAEGTVAQHVAAITASIQRLAPPGSYYHDGPKDLISRYGPTHCYTLTSVAGILEALKNDYERGHLRSVSELIRADLFADFLDMAAHLTQEGYKDAAAVLAGGVLEEHLRKLCLKNLLDPDNAGRPKKADQMNHELSAKSVYSKLDQKSITAWLDLRNKAAHGKYSEYSIGQVELFVQALRDFISRAPA